MLSMLRIASKTFASTSLREDNVDMLTELSSRQVLLGLSQVNQRMGSVSFLFFLVFFIAISMFHAAIMPVLRRSFN